MDLRDRGGCVVRLHSVSWKFWQLRLYSCVLFFNTWRCCGFSLLYLRYPFLIYKSLGLLLVRVVCIFSGIRFVLAELTGCCSSREGVYYCWSGFCPWHSIGLRQTWSNRMVAMVIWYGRIRAQLGLVLYIARLCLFASSSLTKVKVFAELEHRARWLPTAAKVATCFIFLCQNPEIDLHPSSLSSCDP
jgi:hypothetical protein